MKTIFTIHTHSFVDLITNSSSELYVCDSSKTLAMVEKVLNTLLEMHNKCDNTEYTYDQCFAPLETSKYTFQYNDVPQEIQDEQETYWAYGSPFIDRLYRSSEDRSDENKMLESKEYDLMKKYNIHEKNLYVTNREEYDRRYKEYRKAVDELWTDYGVRAYKSKMAIFVEFLKQNKYSDEDINKINKFVAKVAKKHSEKKGGKYLSFWDHLPNFLKEELSTFEFWFGYGITANKGDVIVKSIGDNSIPYELMDSITSYLNADRYHAG